MKNTRRISPNIYRAPARTLEIAGPALPRWTPPFLDMLPEGEESRPVLIPISLEGSETIGQLYRYVVQCRTDIEVPLYPDVITLDLDSIVGTEVTVFIDIPGKGTFIPGMPGETGQGNIGFGIREISGIVTESQYVRHDDRAIVYEFVIEPALARATQGCNYRVFQNRTVIEVIEDLLADYPMSIDWRISGPLVIRNYPMQSLIRQHFESDFTFFQRLCERNGLFYWFEHSNAYHRIVIADTMSAFHSQEKAYETIRFSTEDRIDEEHIDQLKIRSRQTEGKVTVVDHDYTRPRLARNNLPLREESDEPRDTSGAHQEFYAYANVSEPLHGAQGLSSRPNDVAAEARFVALVRMQALRCKGLRASGHGNIRGLKAGFTFMLVGHPYQSANQEYVVTCAKLKMTEVGQASGAVQTFSCETDFEIQPVHEYFRMPLDTPWPRVGVERAIVTGPEGREIWTDGYGRIKCQLVPDRAGNFDENSFIWVSPIHPWQHGQMGTAAVPRIGSEVYIGYVNANPDMPIMLGSTVNARNQPGWTLPANQWLSGLRSRMQGGVSSNHLALDDTKDKQQAQLASDHAQSRLVLGYNTRIASNEGRQEPRGEGFELATEAHGVARANKGMLLTTEPRSGAQAASMDRGETVLRLRRAIEQHDVLAAAAVQAGAQQSQDRLDVSQAFKQQVAELADTGTDGLGGPSKPHLTIASSAGIAVSATADTHLSCGRHVALTSGHHTSVSAGGNLLAAARKAIRIFAYQLGVRIISYAEDINISALKKNLHLLAKLEITQTANRIMIKASEEVMLHGGDSYISLKSGKITVGSRLYEVNAQARNVPPKPMGVSSNGLPDVKANDQTFRVLTPTGMPLPGVDYQIKTTSGGHIFRTDDLGRSPALNTEEPENADFQLHWDEFATAVEHTSA